MWAQFFLIFLKYLSEIWVLVKNLLRFDFFAWVVGFFTLSFWANVQKSLFYSVRNATSTAAILRPHSFFILQFSHWEMCSQHPVIKSQELNQHLTALRWRKSNPTRWLLPLCNSKRRGRVTFFVSPWRKSWHGTENGVLNIQIAREFAVDFQWKICSMNCQREEYKWLWHFLQCGFNQIGIFKKAWQAMKNGQITCVWKRSKVMTCGWLMMGHMSVFLFRMLFDRYELLE